MSVYDSRMKSHLTQYKRDRLGIAEDGMFFGNGKDYGHILPEQLKKLNIVEQIRSEFWEYYEEKKAELPLHTYFHHLNSSQAFAFNLFFPWFGMDESPAPLLSALSVAGRTVKEWQFEAMPNQAEGTSIDFYAEFTDGSRLLVEVKLTENQFGKSLSNERRQTKLRDTYAPSLASKVHPGMLEEGNFFLHYQLCRNISQLNLANGDTLVLLLPRANELTWQDALRFRDEQLTESCRAAVRVIGVEDLVTTLLAAPGISGRLRQHLAMLSEKYLPPIGA